MRKLPPFLIFGSCLLLFGLLLFKDPFSTRSLIPNLEPYPDTFHYINGARSLLSGYGLKIVREGRVTNTSVPPLYSLVLVPAFIISNDPRVFYFINIILAILSFSLFYLILKKLINNQLIIFITLFLYTTNYFIYWLPTLAMAENLILPLFLLAVLLLISKPNIKNIIFAGFVCISFYATKYASIPLSASFGLIYLIKVMLSQKNLKTKIARGIHFSLSTIFFFLLLSLSEYMFKGISIFSSWFNFINAFSPGNIQTGSSSGDSSWFSIYYLRLHLSIYLQALIGKQMRFLWDFTPLVPGFVGTFGLVGLVFNVFSKKLRLLSTGLLLMLLTSILFIASFYAVDARYIYQVIPTLLLGFALLLSIAFRYLKDEKLRFLFNLLMVIFLIFYVSTSFLRIKNQIMLNLRHAETPWYYVSVLEMNRYFSGAKIKDGKKPILISAMPPYYIDFFSNGNYTLLPLSSEQEFRNRKEAAWGPNNYSDLTKLYVSYLKKGYSLYVDRYGIGNEGYLNESFNNLSKSFKVVLVQEACFNQCNIYKLEQL